MASTFKLPLAIYCLMKVDNKELSLDQQIPINAFDMRDGSGTLNKQAVPKDVLSLAELIHLMMTTSDNTATDIILRLCGGPGQLTRWLNECIGLKEIFIKNSCLSILSSYYGIKNLPDDGRCTIEQFSQLKDQVAPLKQKEAAELYLSNHPDCATPRNINLLLQKLVSGELLQSTSKTFLLKTMAQCTTGLERIRKLLPSNTFVADKTGTIGDLVADVALIELPDEKGQIIIAIYVQVKKNSLPTRENFIAMIANEVYKFFITVR